ncbi:copper chaperone CopZ [Gorillibacterium timonense]|uniref:copper chaperone CopZ n=1 Tax=Gorillibacterium timonense TaxID=1689269 RepID=UPI00071E1E55|nr:copper chaperone CopZ [Gorillibacterium timonense]
MAQVVLNVEGMSCNHCVQAVEKALGKLSGVDKVKVELAEKKVSVDYEENQVTVDALKSAIEDQGYDVVG